MGKLHVAFLWHFHQPPYKGPSEQYVLPWVRLRALKDYYTMAALLKEFPLLEQTFNFTPCLLRQLIDYASGRGTDRAMALAAKPAAELSEADACAILDDFFAGHIKNMIEPYPRYRELLAEREPGTHTAREVLDRFSERDLRDLQVWANLAWCSPILQEQCEPVATLIEKGQDFAEEEKQELLTLQREQIGDLLAFYRALQTAGQIEISTSPFYHPILPLLCDMAAAREGMPGVQLPEGRSSYREDAAQQLGRAVRLYEARFGRRPAGLWPPEGAVSPDVVPLAAAEGFQWMASDEGVLAKSIEPSFSRSATGELPDPDVLYQPYLLEQDGARIQIIFRDRVLSDLIAFHYSYMPAKRAADDFIRRLRRIRKASKRPHTLVSVILDGENPWDNYARNGVEFLRLLYDRLSREPDMETVRVGEYLRMHPAEATLGKLFSGTWTEDQTFKVWVGSEEDRRAWTHLNRARATLVREAASRRKQLSADVLDDAWDAIHAAQASDWFWWYGDDRSSRDDHVFDELFRLHLRKVYLLLGLEVPDVLYRPLDANLIAPQAIPEAR